MTAPSDAALAKWASSTPVSFLSLVSLAVTATTGDDGRIALDFPHHSQTGGNAGTSTWTPTSDRWTNPWPRPVFGANRLDPVMFPTPHVFVVGSPIDAGVIVEAFDLATPVVAVDLAANVIDPAVGELGASGRPCTIVTGSSDVVGPELAETLPSAAHVALPAPHSSLWAAAEVLGANALPELLRALRAPLGAVAA